MAQPDQQAQPTDEPAVNGPDRVIVSAFNMQVQTDPSGARFLMLYHINRREILMLDLNDVEAAERLAGEIKPSRVATPHANGNGGAVLL